MTKGARASSTSKTRYTLEKPEPSQENGDSDDGSGSDDASQFERPSRTAVRGNTLKREIKTELPQSQQQTPASAFAYVQLKPREFRILVLEPGRKDDTVICSFITATIAEAKGTYEAVSYLYANESTILSSLPPAQIELRDSQDPPRSRLIFVKDSLSTALKSLRHRSERRRFWVDFLCIDRSPGSDEQNQQVAMKRDIFYNAENLCFWLGENSSFKAAFSFIPKILDLARVDKLVRDQEAIEDWIAFVALLKSPMFGRLWLVQEVAVAQNVTLHSGQPAIHYQDFVDAVAMFVSCRPAITDLFRQNKGHYKGLSDREITIALRFIDITSNALRGSKRQLTLETLVSQLSDLSCGFPRDRIFSMLSLAKDTESTLMEKRIDYTSRSTMEIYQDFVIHAIENSKSIDIICRRWASPVPENEPKYPSWIQPSLQSSLENSTSERTDADSLVGLPGHNNYSASKSKAVKLPLETNFLADGRKSLSVTGHFLDTISTLGPRCSEGVIQYEWLELGKCIDTDTTETVPEAFWRTLVADRGPSGTNAPSWYHRALLYCLQQRSPNGDINTNKIIDQSEAEAPLVVDFLRRVQSVIWNRKFLVSRSKALIGLAPMTAQPGDVICILHGCSVPVVLRSQTLDGVASWTFIGECYVHGMMDGEAMEMGHLGAGQADKFELR